ncbi:MAG: hypothetical protein WC799_04115 [Desulfobacteraceae bacterium]|jgi:hypothetical protein
MKLKTCVSPSGRFVYGVHHPFFHIENFREKDGIQPLGWDESGDPVFNQENFPVEAVDEAKADIIYEVPNAFPFRGSTYIASGWADVKSANPGSIQLTFQKPLSFTDSLKKSLGHDVDMDNVFSNLPQQVLLTIAAESNDIDELTRLASICCVFHLEIQGAKGLVFKRETKGGARSVIKNHVLFETLVNNPCLPDFLKEVMVLRPGVQGGSEIVGEYNHDGERVHIYEYLRRNSYIPWGHFAANMAEDAVRYDMTSMSQSDMTGLRHLYYQRTYSRVADMLGLPGLIQRKTATENELEDLRLSIVDRIKTMGNQNLFFNATLWGWNYGFSFTANGYNLHGSHQQVHQQFALIPKTTEAHSGFDRTEGLMETYGCGDQVYAFIKRYREETGHHFFDDYLSAIESNRRMDRTDDNRASLVVYADDHVILFVPKAQTSQWELNLMPRKPIANIIETDATVRQSLDTAMHKAMTALTTLGAKMISVIELSGRFGVYDEKQHLLYSFLPKIPYSMGAFTEAQQRYINGHYPEDFAEACREVMQNK